MIRSLINYLPPLDQLKEEIRKSPQALENYISAEILKGPSDSVDFLVKIKNKLNKKYEKNN